MIEMRKTAIGSQFGSSFGSKFSNSNNALGKAGATTIGFNPSNSGLTQRNEIAKGQNSTSHWKSTYS